MISVWVYLVSTAVACMCAWLWDRQRYARRLLADLPQYKSLPFIGNIHQFLGDGRMLFHQLDKISQIVEESMTPFVIWLGPCPILVTHMPEDVSTITNAFIEKPYYYSFGRCWLGEGLVTASETALGLPEVSEIVTTEYYNAFSRTLELLLTRGLNPFLHPDCIYRLTSAHKELGRCIAVLHNVSETIIAKRKSQRETTKEAQSLDKENRGEPKFKSFLDILLDLSDLDPSFTEQQIKSEVDTIIVGGQETVATTLFHVLLMIGREARVQEALHAEMKSIFGDSDRPVEKDDLPRMKYCEAVISETLRMFPPVPGVMRHAERDLQIKSCTIPKGTACAVNMWGAGRSARAWGPDAGVFRPERWLGDRPANAAALLAFSYGRRACIGKKYAMPFMKTILACCVRDLQFESQAGEMEFKIDIALRPVSGHLIQVKLREG